MKQGELCLQRQSLQLSVLRDEAQGAGRSQQPVLGSPELWAQQGPFQTHSHVRNATHQRDEPVWLPFLPSLLFPAAFPMFSSWSRVVSFLPSCPTSVAVTLHCPPPQPCGQCPTCTSWCLLHPALLQSRRGWDPLDVKAPGRTCCHVPLAMVRQLLPLTV